MTRLVRNLTDGREITKINLITDIRALQFVFLYETLRSSNNSLKRVRVFRIELEFRSVGVLGKGKTGIHGEKPLRARAGSHW